MKKAVALSISTSSRDLRPSQSSRTGRGEVDGGFRHPGRGGPRALARVPTGRRTLHHRRRATASSWSAVAVAPLATGLLVFPRREARASGSRSRPHRSPPSGRRMPSSWRRSYSCPASGGPLCLLAILPFHLFAQLRRYPLPQVLIQYAAERRRSADRRVRHRDVLPAAAALRSRAHGIRADRLRRNHRAAAHERPDGRSLRRGRSVRTTSGSR